MRVRSKKSSLHCRHLARSTRLDRTHQGFAVHMARLRWAVILSRGMHGKTKRQNRENSTSRKMTTC